MYLSVFVVIITCVSITSKTVSRKERGEGLTYANLAILRLEKRQKIQGALGVVTTMASIYLFSVLGVQGDPNIYIGWVGAVGALALFIGALIEMFALGFGGSWVGERDAGTSEAPRSNLSGASDFGSEKSSSLGMIDGDMTVASFI